jgi:hypothetical protein
MEQLLGTPGNRADAAGIFQHALAALQAALPIAPFPVTTAQRNGIAPGVYNLIHHRCRSLDADAATEHQQGVGVYDLTLMGVEGHPGELVIAGEVNE